MKKTLKLITSLTVEMLRTDRSLRIEIIGELSARLRGDVSELRGNVSGITGDVSGITGDVSGITGDVSGITGDVSELRGNVSGITGDVSGLRGNADECEITDEERSEGISIANLVATDHA